MRRVFIIRKDLHMSPGKLAAQVSHCAEAYWTRWIQNNVKRLCRGFNYEISGFLPSKMVDGYVRGSFVKIVCEAKNKNHLMKAVEIAVGLGLELNVDFGFIYDNCMTELEPEEPDGTTLTGIWFGPLKDEDAHKISKKYQLYK